MTSDTTSAAVDPYAALPARPVDPALFTDEDTYRRPVCPWSWRRR